METIMNAFQTQICCIHKILKTNLSETSAIHVRTAKFAKCKLCIGKTTLKSHLIFVLYLLKSLNLFVLNPYILFLKRIKEMGWQSVNN